MREISIGAQGFDRLRERGCFYIDKTSFIREWWESENDVTLITRPRRFGKTLNMSMLECFFSNRYDGRSDLFEGLDIWNDVKYREIQGSYPVIFLSFANVKENNFKDARLSIIETLQSLFDTYKTQWNDDPIDEKEKYAFLDIDADTPDPTITRSLQKLSYYMYQRYGRKVLIFLDEYDTPLQEAYLNGYWDQMSDFIRSLFNSTFKTNTSLERAVMTGITRVSKESIFSDLNNPDVVTTTSNKYQTAFGFTQQEVNAALEEYGLSDQTDEVKKWYDGFTFGERKDIYNPWSITKFLDERKFDTYWSNTSSNRLVSELIRKSDSEVKYAIEDLISGRTLDVFLKEDMDFAQLDSDPENIWALFLASGYLKVVDTFFDGRRRKYRLAITNLEVELMFEDLISEWFSKARVSNDGFVKAMINGDVKQMNGYMNRIALTTISFFDAGQNASDETTPERFYHGFVLGMMVRENDRYTIRSNRESGLGRYDICMYPKEKNLPGIVIEFKVSEKEEVDLSETADVALEQIREKDYAADLRANGVENIFQYGFAFKGKAVLIKKA